jgi:EPS-associated MarR family transcriptional regulator
MEFSEKDFEVMDALDCRRITTQRQLSEHTGISLGKVNTVLKVLLDKGFIKLGHFHQNRKKIAYTYLLTPKGFDARSRLAVDFVTAKLKEFQALQHRVAHRLARLEKTATRIVFVGPHIVNDLLRTTILSHHLNLELVAHFPTLDHMNRASPDHHDVVLVFDRAAENGRKAKGKVKDRHAKIIPLW